MTAEGRVVIEPQVTDLTRPYWDAAARGVIALQRCVACGAVWHPPQPTCPECRRAEIEWFDAAGSGTIHSFTVVHHVTHPAVAQRTPYVVALVELTEGPRVICNVLDANPDDVAVGRCVTIASGLSPAGAELPQARPVGAELDGGP
jgi:uncharacterized OB-fold protein